MSLEFVTGSSSTAFAIGLLGQCVAHDSILASTLSSAEQWRGNYQKAFARLTCLEAQENGVALQRKLLDQLAESIRDSSGHSLKQLTSDAALSEIAKVHSVIIRGDGPVVPLATVGAATADALISHRLAESAIKDPLEAFDARVAIDPDFHETAATEVLVAVGANAELSLAPEWLGLGATVVAVARHNIHKWARLIETARASAGVLIVPVLASRVQGKSIAELDDFSLAEVAGLDLESDISAITKWIIEQAILMPHKRFNLLGTIYAPGKHQILASAAQDAIFAKVLSAIGANRATVGWLATPLDSVLLSAEYATELSHDYAKRNFAVRQRDSFWQIFGGLRPASPQPCATPDGAVTTMVIADFSAQRQGSSYLLAKRIERWRANVAAAEGFKVWYQVTPAAITHSTVGYKVVRAAYRGARKLGVTTFEPWMLRDLLCAVLVGHLAGRDSNAVDSNTAIHGGIWRLPYDPQTIWKAAAVMGWVELFKPGK